MRHDLARENTCAQTAWQPAPRLLLGRPDFHDPLRIQVTRRRQGRESPDMLAMCAETKICSRRTPRMRMERMGHDITLPVLHADDMRVTGSTLERDATPTIH